MKIVVIGGSGLIGSKLVAKLRERGHETLAASPASGVNTLTGQGLAAAVDGASVVAESAETVVCAYLSAALLAGLVLNAAFGLWWADPVAAVGIAVIAAREGVEAWRGDACCALD